MKTRRIVEVTIAALMFVSVPLSHLSFAQSNSPVFDHTTRHVRDLQKSGEFYDKVLQLKRIPEPFKDNNHIWYRIGPHEQLHVVGKAADVQAPHVGGLGAPRRRDGPGTLRGGPGPHRGLSRAR